MKDSKNGGKNSQIDSATREIKNSGTGSRVANHVPAPTPPPQKQDNSDKK